MTLHCLSPAELLQEFQPGRSIYIPGASGELRFLQQLLRSEPDSLSGVTLVSCLLPGMNTFDYAALHPDCRLETFLLPPPLQSSFAEGRVVVVPLSYSAIGAYLAARTIDVAFLHLTPPRNGICSFGIAADFGPIVAGAARRRIGVVNRAMPRPVHTAEIALESLDAWIEVDEGPRPEPAASASTEELDAIAARVAMLVPDGATLQTGIGRAPAAVWDALRTHKGLRLWSGVVTDGFFGALDAGAAISADHVAGIAHGSTSLYARLDGNAAVRFVDVRTTHDAASMAAIDGFVAVNSALEIDLFGQVNLEWQGGRPVSGIGGAPDFGSAARRSRGGRSILALPATARGGAVSRLVVRMSAPTISLSRSEVDTVVTEHGVASLANLSMHARAEALIAIAAPTHRAALEHDWALQWRL